MATTADTFVGQLQDSRRPAVCPKCLYVFAGALLDEANEDVAVQLMKTHHAFFSLCARVASAPGASEDLTPLRPLLNASAAACSTKRYHSFAGQALGDSVACVMDALCQCLFVAITRGSQRKHKKVLLSKSGLWPSTLEDLIPTDAKAYIRWAGTLPTWCALAFLSRLLVVARRKVIEDLSCTPSRDQICAVVVRSMRLWRVPDSEFRPEILPHLYHDVPLGRPRPEEAIRMIGQVLGLLAIFEDGPDRSLDDFWSFCAGYERLLHDAIIVFVEDPTSPYAARKDRLICVASMLSIRLNLAVHPLVQNYLELKRSEPAVHNPARDGMNLADTILMYLRQRRDDRTCSGPGCENYAREGETGTCALAVCGRCKLLHYCSPECQKRDWSIGRDGVTHKVVCSALCKLDEAGVSPRTASMGDFSDVFFDNTTLTDEEYTSLAKYTLLDDRVPVEFKVGAVKLFMQLSVENSGREIV